MRRLLLILLIAIAAVPVFAEYPPKGWTDSITDAISRADREDKMIMLNFTGSDWCSWCKKLESEVWSKPEFSRWADKNLVKVFIDFPRGIDLSENQKNQNYLLQEVFGVQGYPTIFLLDSNLTPLLKTGYRDGGAAEYVRHLEKDRNLKVDSPEGFALELRGIIEQNVGPIR